MPQGGLVPSTWAGPVPAGEAPPAVTKVAMMSGRQIVKAPMKRLTREVLVALGRPDAGGIAKTPARIRITSGSSIGVRSTLDISHPGAQSGRRTSAATRTS